MSSTQVSRPAVVAYEAEEMPAGAGFRIYVPDTPAEHMSKMGWRVRGSVLDGAHRRDPVGGRLHVRLGVGRFNGRIREDIFGDRKAAQSKKLKLAICGFLKEVAAFVVTGRTRPSQAEMTFDETTRLENAICRRLRW